MLSFSNYSGWDQDSEPYHQCLHFAFRAECRQFRLVYWFAHALRSRGGRQSTSHLRKGQSAGCAIRLFDDVYTILRSRLFERLVF